MAAATLNSSDELQLDHVDVDSDADSNLKDDVPATSIAVFLAKFGFWVGVAIAVAGNAVTFVPGGEVGWFACSGVLIGMGFFVPGRAYWIGAALGCILCVMGAISRYPRGVAYEEWLRAR